MLLLSSYQIIPVALLSECWHLSFFSFTKGWAVPVSGPDGKFSIRI